MYTSYIYIYTYTHIHICNQQTITLRKWHKHNKHIIEYLRKWHKQILIYATWRMVRTHAAPEGLNLSP